MFDSLHYPKPAIAVSRCLGFDACRYNGVTINSDTVNALREYVQFLPCCPEVSIGLGVPRQSVRIVEDDDGARKLMQSGSERDLTSVMTIFAETYLANLPEVDGFLLKESSPSCGMKNVKRYPSLGKVPAKMGRGEGFYGGAVLNHFPDHPIEDEGRIRNFTLRERFLTAVFTRARFRETKADCARTHKLGPLVEFHTRHKFLFMAIHEPHLRMLGKIVANHEGKSNVEVLRSYEEELIATLAKPIRYTAQVNVLQHVLGFLPDADVSHDEKQYVLGLINDYRNETIPLSSVVSVLKAYVVRFRIGYLENQYYFAPYPLALVEISDSGKGRNYSR